MDFPPITSPQVPPGYLFQPSDEVLVRNYLHPKVTGGTLPCQGVVIDYDLYGNEHPHQIWEKFKNPALDETVDLYFFTGLKKKKNRISRTIKAGGTWSNEASEVVYSRNTNQPIATKRRFHYENKNSQQHGCWIMHEYSLEVEGSVPLLTSSDRSSSSSPSYVLCRMRKNEQNNNTDTTSRRRKRSQPQPQVQNSNIDAVVSLSLNLEQEPLPPPIAEHEQIEFEPLRTNEQWGALVSDQLLQRTLPDVGGGHVSDFTH